MKTTERRLYILNLAGGFATLLRAQGETVSEILHECVVSDTSGHGPLAQCFLEEMRKIKNQRAKAYRIVVEGHFTGEIPTFVFLTTSKDLVLKLASLTEYARSLLGRIIDEEFEERGPKEMLFGFQVSSLSDEQEKMWLVTRTRRGTEITLTVSPAP